MQGLTNMGEAQSFLLVRTIYIYIFWKIYIYISVFGQDIYIWKNKLLPLADRLHWNPSPWLGQQFVLTEQTLIVDSFVFCYRLNYVFLKVVSPSPNLVSQNLMIIGHSSLKK